MSYARFDVVNLEFSEEDLAEINKCLNCTLPESDCHGLKRCQTRVTTCEKIHNLAKSGYSMDEVEKTLCISHGTVYKALSDGVTNRVITNSKRKEILRLLQTNKLKKNS